MDSFAEIIFENGVKRLQHQLNKFRCRRIDAKCMQQHLSILKLFLLELGGKLNFIDETKPTVEYLWYPPEDAQLVFLGKMENVSFFYFLGSGNEVKIFAIWESGRIEKNTELPDALIREWQEMLGYIENDVFEGFLWQK